MNTNFFFPLPSNTDYFFSLIKPTRTLQNKKQMLATNNNMAIAKTIELVPLTNKHKHMKTTDSTTLNIENEENTHASVFDATKNGAIPKMIQSSKSVSTIPSCLEMALEMADKAAAATATKKHVAAITLQALARGFAQRKVYQRIMSCMNFFAAGKDTSAHDFDMETLCKELAISIHLPLQQKINIVISGGFPGFYWNKNMKKVFVEIVAAAATRAEAAKQVEDDKAAAKAEEAREIEGKKRLKSLSIMFQRSAERMNKKNSLTVKKTFNSVGRVRFVLTNKKASRSSSSPLTSSVPEQQEMPTVRKAPRRRSSPLFIPSSKQQDLRARLDEYQRKKKEKKADDMKLKKKKMWRR